MLFPGSTEEGNGKSTVAAAFHLPVIDVFKKKVLMHEPIFFFFLKKKNKTVEVMGNTETPLLLKISLQDF